MSTLVTGAAGFIGSHLVRRLRQDGTSVVSLDALAYAGSRSSLDDLDDDPGHVFVEGDVADDELVASLLAEHDVDVVVHLAALTHVDRSIDGPVPFVETNTLGTAHLLETIRHHHGTGVLRRFVHVSTDEVYGDLGAAGFFDEHSPRQPSSPYAASKASADHLAAAWRRTYGLPTVVVNLTNVYGPRQHPEKLIPLTIRRLAAGARVPLYGDGGQERDWMHVSDAVEAIVAVAAGALHHHSYVAGPGMPVTNQRIVEMVADVVDDILERDAGSSRSLVRSVEDRPGHDRRYAVRSDRIETDLDWRPGVTLDEGLRETVEWYLANEAWVEQMTERSGDFEERWYRNR